MSEPARQGMRADDPKRDQLEALLRSSADPDGFIPFDRFMEVALYGEGVGFYTRTGSPFGGEGDFYTAAHASPLFGRTLAERVKVVGSQVSSPGPFRVVELGPGDGVLAEEIVTALASDDRLRRRLEYVLVERSPSLALRSFERVAAVGDRFGIPVRAAGSIGADGPFRGVVLANEVLDAQPVRRLLWEDRGWRELGVRLEDHRIVRATGPLERVVPPPELPRNLDTGTVVEVSPMAEAIVRDVADHLVEGLFLAIDYGMEQSELVVAHPSGTLAAVARHRPVPDPMAAPGRTDLSVFVNFTSVRAAAHAAGLREVSFRHQAMALADWGLPRLLEEAARSAPSSEAEVRLRLSAKNLLFGFERFQVLELAPPLGPRELSDEPVR